MPFSSVDSLPAFVKKLPAKKQRQWMSVFNSAFSKAVKEGKSTKDAEGTAFRQANGVVKKAEGGLQKFDDPADTHVDATVQERNKSAHGSGSSSTGKKRKKKKLAVKPKSKGVYNMSTVDKFIDATNRLIGRSKPILNKYDLMEKGVDEETIEKIGVFDDQGNLVPHDREETDTFESTSHTKTQYDESGTRTEGERTSRSTFISTVIIKAVDKREWIIYGIAMEPTAVGTLVDDGEGGQGFQGEISKLDSHDQFTTDLEIRKAMIGFMEELHKTKGEPNNIQHKRGLIPQTAVIENFQAPVDYELNGETVAKGSWVMGIKIYEPSVRKAIERGDITGFSIEGKGILSPVI